MFGNYVAVGSQDNSLHIRLFGFSGEILLLGEIFISFFLFFYFYFYCLYKFIQNKFNCYFSQGLNPKEG